MFYIFYRFLFHLCKVLKFELWHSSYNYGDAEIMVLLMLQSHFFVYSGGYHLHVTFPWALINQPHFVFKCQNACMLFSNPQKCLL